MKENFSEDFFKNKCYLADSAMVFRENIARMRAPGMHGFGRLSARFKRRTE